MGRAELGDGRDEEEAEDAEAEADEEEEEYQLLAHCPHVFLSSVRNTARQPGNSFCSRATDRERNSTTCS